MRWYCRQLLRRGTLSQILKLPGMSPALLYSVYFSPEQASVSVRNCVQATEAQTRLCSRAAVAANEYAKLHADATAEIAHLQVIVMDYRSCCCRHMSDKSSWPNADSQSGIKTCCSHADHAYAGGNISTRQLMMRCDGKFSFRHTSTGMLSASSQLLAELACVGSKLCWCAGQSL